MGWEPIQISQAELFFYDNEATEKAKFLVDESVGVDVVQLLQRSDWNARYVAEGGLSGRSDEDVLAFAQRDDRVLITHDRGYLNDRRFPEHRNPGIVVLPGGDGDVSALVESIQWMLSIVGGFRELWRRAKVEIGRDGQFTVRVREADTGRVTSRRYWVVQNNGILQWHDD